MVDSTVRLGWVVFDKSAESFVSKQECKPDGITGRCTCLSRAKKFFTRHGAENYAELYKMDYIVFSTRCETTTA